MRRGWTLNQSTEKAGIWVTFKLSLYVGGPGYRDPCIDSKGRSSQLPDSNQPASQLLPSVPVFLLRGSQSRTHTLSEAEHLPKVAQLMSNRL